MIAVAMKKLMLLIPVLFLLGGCFECEVETPLFGTPSLSCDQT